jgi:uncharacterized repeat protein (TIGR01451 family)
MKQRILSLFLIVLFSLGAFAALSWSVSGAAASLPGLHGPENLDADLGVQLVSQPRPIILPSPIDYTLVVTSDRLQAITAVTLTLDLPDMISGLTYVAESGVFNPASGAWTGVALSLTAPITLHISGNIDPLDAGGARIISSAAAVTTTQAVDPNPDNNTAVDLNDLIYQDNLGLTLVSAPSPVVAGTVVTYTAVVANSSAVAPVTIANLALDIDAEVTNLVYAPSAGTFDPNSGDWTGFVLTPTSPITLTIAGLVSPGATGELSAAATITSSQVYDPAPDNNTATDLNPIIQQADLGVDKTASHASIVAGELLTYTILVENHGPSDTANVVLTDTLPAQTEFVSTSDPGQCALTPENEVVCQWPYLEAGETIELLLVVAVDLEASGSLLNVVEVSGDAEDLNPDNNVADVTTPIVPAVADLSVSKSASHAVVIAGERLTYTIALENNGPADALNVVLTDTLPGGVTFVSIDNANCAFANGAVVCSWSELAADAEVELELVVAVDPTTRGSLTNLVEVDSDTPDQQPGNNNDEVVTAVTAVADLSLSKTASPLVVAGRTPFTYTLVLQNNGPSAALETILTDNWPAGLELLSSPPGCSLSGQIVTCDLGTLLPNTAAAIHLMARATTVHHANNTTVTNEASAVSDAGSSNAASVVVTITPYRLYLPVLLQPAEWRQVGTIPAGVTAFYDLAACNDEMFAGANNGVYRWQNGGWQLQATGPTTRLTAQFAFAGANCDRLYAASFGEGLWLATRIGGNWIWAQVNSELQWARSVVVRDNTVFLAGDFGLYQANTATHIFNPTQITARVNNLTLDGNGTTLFAAVWNGGVYVNNGGPAWAAVGLPTNTAVWRVIGDGNGGPLLLGSEAGINQWRSGNWAAVAPGYNGRSRALAAAEGALYASQLGQGVIASYDGGNSWRPISNGLPPVAPTDDFFSLRAMPDGYLYMTGEIGIWRWPIP